MNEISRIALTYVLPVLITGVIGWFAGQRNDGTSRESVYAEHTVDLWNRLDKVSENLEKVTQERDDLKDRVEGLQEQVDQQSRVIDELNQSIQQLKQTLTK